MDSWDILILLIKIGTYFEKIGIALNFCKSESFLNIWDNWYFGKKEIDMCCEKCW